MKTDFHQKIFALRLALKRRQTWTRKWPILVLYTGTAILRVIFIELDLSFQNPQPTFIKANLRPKVSSYACLGYFLYF